MRASASPKAPSTKRGLAERSEVWGSLRELLPPDRRWRSSPLYEEGGFFRCGGVRAEQSPAPTGTSEVQRKLGGLNPLSLREAQTAPLDAIKGSLWLSQTQPRRAGLRITRSVRPVLCQMTESPIFFNCSCNLSAISAINSELVGFPFVFETV